MSLTLTSPAPQVRRVLDYFVADPTATHFFRKPRLVTGTPWSPHSGIAIDIVGNAKTVFVHKHVRGSPLLDAHDARCRLDKITPATSDQWQRAGWCYKVGERKFHKATGSLSDLFHPAGGGFEDGAGWCSGKTYAGWSARAAGALALKASNDAYNPARETRGIARISKVVPLRPYTLPDVAPVSSVSCYEPARLWRGAEHQLRLLEHFDGTERRHRQRDDAVAWLRGRILPRLGRIWQPRLRRIWKPGPAGCRKCVAVGDDTFSGRPRARSDSDAGAVPDPEGHTVWEEVPIDGDTHAIWCRALTHPSLVTRGRWQCLASEAARIGAVGRKKAKSGARRELSAWVDEILLGAASKGRCFINAVPGAGNEALGILAIGFDAVELAPDAAVAAKGSFWHDLREEALL